MSYPAVRALRYGASLAGLGALAAAGALVVGLVAVDLGRPPSVAWFVGGWTLSYVAVAATLRKLLVDAHRDGGR